MVCMRDKSVSETGKFLLKIWSKDTFAERSVNFLNRPKATFVHLHWVNLDRTVIIMGDKHIDHFTLSVTVEDIAGDFLILKVSDSKFLSAFTEHSLLNLFSVVDMSAHRCIPTPWLDILAHRSFLQE